MNNIFYTKWTHKWQNILTVVHLVFLLLFTTSLVLLMKHNSLLSKDLFIVSILLAIVLSIFKAIAVKKKDIIEEEKLKIIDSN